MKHIWILIKKELKRFFTDRRMLLSLLLPGIMIYAIYSLMGGFMGNIGSEPVDYKYQVVIVNQPTEISFSGINIEYLTIVDETEIKEKIENKEIDLYIKFPENFYADAKSGDPGVTLDVRFNTAKTESQAIYSQCLAIINAEFINYEVIPTNYASQKDTSIQVITSLVPMLLMIFLFTAALSTGTESVAGEKERGTMTTLLATPVKRSHIALGKVIALSITALVSATSSFIGLMLSLPNLMKGADITLDMYGVDTYLLLFGVIVTTVLIFVVLVSLVSAYAKSVKEASALASPLMIILVLIGLTSMTGVVQTNTWMYLIPVYNSVQSITAILSNSVQWTNLLVTVIVNLGIVGLGIYLISFMFNSEKIMFNK